ncbi:MAG: ribonuclease PH [Victivallaceae bacterium]|jgi:ribonuclease PH
MERKDGRLPSQLRWVKATKDYLSNPISSVLIEFGKTRVLCAVSVDSKVPGWMRAQKVSGGWLTCEYGMLPASAHDRIQREASSGRQGGRTVEIQRLIGRSLRSVIDLEKIGQNTIYIDCDVIDADGGTRCAGITGASLALQLAFRSAKWQRMFGGVNPMREGIAAVSVGMVNGQPMLDLCYEEDSRADVDCNVIMTESGKFVEIQGTAEREPFSKEQLEQMLSLADSGIRKIFDIQKSVIYGSDNKPHSRPRPPSEINSLADAFSGIKL